MRSPVIAACLALLLSSALSAQSNPSPETQQPATSAPAQTDGKNLLKDPSQDKDKKEDSDGKGKTRVRLGSVSLSASYIHAPVFLFPYGPYGFGFYPYSALYSPFFYDSFYGPFYGPFPYDLAYRPDKGEVKLSAKPKNAQVFLDGAYAGTADRLKSIWLDSAAYDLSISAPGRAPFQKRIYVLSGKSLKIDARLDPQKEKK